MAKTVRLTDAERDARRAQQRQLAIDSVEQLRRSGGWRGYLKARRTLRVDYSARNILLIAAQRPTATHVAGFRAWLDSRLLRAKATRRCPRRPMGDPHLGAV